MKNNLWYKNAIFYEIYVRAFYDGNSDGHGDIKGLIQKLDYLQELGITCLWLLPICPSPLKDDGYDISNHYGVHPDYGTLDDFKELLDSAHARGLRVIMDLVLNHTSDQHPWFRAARANPNSIFRNYYVWSESSLKYRDARIIFTDTEKSNWAWDEASKQYYWHRFFSSQPDLNYENPLVQEEILKIISFWLDLGVDGFRADAVPYLFEREGTSCENLPETHAFLRKIRRFINKNYPGRILMAEANQWPEDVLPYFGKGNDEFHMGFNFPIMPRIFMSIRKADRTQLVWIMGHTPILRESNQWVMFLRNHDELTLEMVTEDERQWMWENYAPEPRMRLNLGIRRRLAPLLDNDRRQIELANSLLFTLPGSPIIYYGDEIGMGDNLDLPDRNGVRTPMQWDNSSNAGFSAGAPFSEFVKGALGYQHINIASQVNDPDSLLHSIKRMIAIRKKHAAFGSSSLEWIETGNSAVAVYIRQYNHDSMLILNNLSSSIETVKLPAQFQKTYLDLFAGHTHTLTEKFELKPYSYLWLQMQK